jgi:quercetin dioxygenase-like cupin family protein
MEQSKCNCRKANVTAKHSEVFNLSKLVSYAEGAVISRTIMENCGGTVTMFSFDAGQGLSEHSAPFDAMLTVLDGEAEIRIGGAPHRLRAGETIIMPADIPHAVSSIGAFKMLLVMLKG